MEEVESKLYYPCWCRLDRRECYFIWYSFYDGGDKDGVVLDASGKIAVFDSPDELSNYAVVKSLLLEQEEPAQYNWDILRNRIREIKHHPRRNTAIDCEAFLGAWNLFADASRSLNVPFDGDSRRMNLLCDKLFWGTNPPALTPVGRFYVPIWTKHERIIIADTLAQGLQTFRENASHHEGNNQQ